MRSEKGEGRREKGGYILAGRGVYRDGRFTIHSAEAMAEIGSFRDLNVYSLAVEQAVSVFEETRSFPQEERYGMSRQIRRSSSAVGPLIAEAWVRRLYRKAFVNSLSQAKGEAYETQAWLDQALRRGYITDERFDELDCCWQHIGAMLHMMIIRADTFVQGRNKGSP